MGNVQIIVKYIEIQPLLRLSNSKTRLDSRARTKTTMEADADGCAEVYHAVASWRQKLCHIEFMYGQLKLLPLSSMSRISVSMGVLPTSLTKNSCSIT